MPSRPILPGLPPALKVRGWANRGLSQQLVPESDIVFIRQTVFTPFYAGAMDPLSRLDAPRADHVLLG
jgi:hypothetical protein